MTLSVSENIAYPVMEHFYTIQGEGLYAGKAAYFIRLGGCDVGCHWCDVKESWSIEAHPKISIKDLVLEAEKYPARIVVITGGEPTMHDLSSLTAEFKSKGFRTHIETSGAYNLTGTWDWVCLSPKKFKLPCKEAYMASKELKIIIFNKSDFEFAEQQSALLPTSEVSLFLQPEWDKKEEVMPLIVEYVKMNPHWSVSLQTHKYLNIP